MKKWGGGQLDVRPPNLIIGGGRVPPSPPRIDAPVFNEALEELDRLENYVLKDGDLIVMDNCGLTTLLM